MSGQPIMGLACLPLWNRPALLGGKARARVRPAFGGKAGGLHKVSREPVTVLSSAHNFFLGGRYGVTAW